MKQFNNVLSRSVIIATGAKALWLGVPGEERLRGKGVSACATCDGFFFREKTVAVVGGGDAALEEALTLTKFATKVYIIHRRDSFRASKIMQKRVSKHPKIEVIWNTQVMEVLGENRVEGIRLTIIDNKDDSVKILSRLNSSLPLVKQKVSKNFTSSSSKLKLDGIFVAIGHKPDTNLFTGQIELDNKDYVITSAKKALEMATLLHSYIDKKEEAMIKQCNNVTMKQFNFSYQSMTSVMGVFAAGDCVDSVYRQASTAAGMGVAAALDAEKWLKSVENS